MLSRDKAQHDNAVVEEDRYRRLVDGGMIAREPYDQIRANELSLAATIKAGQAAVETARAVVRAATGHRVTTSAETPDLAPAQTSSPP